MFNSSLYIAQIFLSKAARSHSSTWKQENQAHTGAEAGRLARAGQFHPVPRPLAYGRDAEGSWLARRGRRGPGRSERLHETGSERAARPSGGALQQAAPGPLRGPAAGPRPVNELGRVVNRRGD
jgi:hypothetical protein